MVPSFSPDDSSIMEDYERWLDKGFGELLRYRLSLVRGKARFQVKQASAPNRTLSLIQEASLSYSPIDTEAWFEKRPQARIEFSPREAPIGPSATLTRLRLAENPHTLRVVERVVGDVDLRAEEGVMKLYSSGVSQRQITRLLSVGLLGSRKERRLVPTEWSITAIDDIIARRLRERVIKSPEIEDFLLFGDKALDNNVQILLLPSRWMFEALEGWLRSPDSKIASDYELAMGRSGYPRELLGAYHASRLPILEHLSKISRQAGAIAFLEVGASWIPLGVFRFREIARRALAKAPIRLSSLDEALEALSHRLTIPLRRWLERSRLIRYFRSQHRIEGFLS